MKTLVVSLLTGLLIFSGALSGVWAEEYGLGDLGKPENYDKTISLWSDKVKDLQAVAANFPSSFSWAKLGKVTPAKIQGACGSCWAFTCVGALESKIMMKGGPAYDLSEQQPISCDKNMKGCCGGWMSAIQYWEKDGPISELCGPYRDGATRCGSPPHSSVPCGDMDKCKRFSFQVTGYYTVKAKDINEIKTSLYFDGPSYFRYDVYADFMEFWSKKSQETVYHQKTGDRLGGHAVLIIGWDDNKKAWLCKNSWGTSRNRRDGYFWIGYGGHAKDLHFGMANFKLGLKSDK